MTTRHELLASAIESLRILGDPNGDYSLADCDAAQEIIREFDNLPPAVAAEPVAWQYLSDHGWIECGTRDTALVATKAGFKTRSLYTEQPPVLSAELKTSLRELVLFCEMWPEDDEGGHAALVQAFLDSAK